MDVDQGYEPQRHLFRDLFHGLFRDHDHDLDLQHDLGERYGLFLPLFVEPKQFRIRMRVRIGDYGSCLMMEGRQRGLLHLFFV